MDLSSNPLLKYELILDKNNLVMTLVGKSGGKPKHGCPFCSASTPYSEKGHLYTLGDLLELHQVKHYFYLFHFFTNLFLIRSS